MHCVISGAVGTQEHESDGRLVICVYSLCVAAQAVVAEGLTDVAG